MSKKHQWEEMGTDNEDECYALEDGPFELFVYNKGFSTWVWALSKDGVNIKSSAKDYVRRNDASRIGLRALRAGWSDCGA